MKLLEGRTFAENIASDTAAIIINQAAVKELGLKDPIGKRIQNWRPYTVIGVVEDFHYETMREKISPLAFVLGTSPGIVSVKMSGSDVSATLRSIEDVWKKFAPHQPIRYSFMDDSFARMYDDIQRMGHIFTTFAVLAIIVACLGLFALSAFMVEQRSKEISIRLVLGASLNNVFNLLTLNFLKLVLISIVLATPVAWYFMQKWLEDFTYKTSITWDIFFTAGVSAIAIALGTVSYQAIRAALLNPVENLKTD
jgi:putative ABC transport system permease protein